MADTAEPKQLTAASALATPILSGEIHAEPCRHLHVYAAPQCGARKTDPLIVPRPARRRRNANSTTLPDAARALSGTNPGDHGCEQAMALARNANVVAECGSGKTLIALGSMLVHSAGRPYSGLVMAPPHLVEKWARETFLTLPQVRVFLIDDIRNGGDPTQPHGINEVRMRRGEIVREGLHTSLAELRRLGRKGWRELCPGTTMFCIGREKAKCSSFWNHCYGKSRSGRYLGSVTNPDTGCPVETDGVRLSALDFEKKRLHQIVDDSRAGKTKYSALWQADGNKIVRMAPAEYMGRYMPEWFDYAIADEIHQLAGDTAQGNALGVLNRTARRFLGLTGTLLSGYADDLFNTLFRTDARRMTGDGYEWGSAGRERFTRGFGVIETIERITVEDNACSKIIKKTVRIKRD